MTDCKCKEIHCRDDGTYDIVTQNSRKETQFYFNSIPHDVLDALCGSCPVVQCNSHNAYHSQHHDTHEHHHDTHHHDTHHHDTHHHHTNRFLYNHARTDSYYPSVTNSIHMNDTRYFPRSRLFQPRYKLYGKHNEEYNEPTHSCDNQTLNNLGLSCTRLPNAKKLYTKQYNSSFIIPSELPYDFHFHDVHGVPISQLQNGGYLLWFYNLHPNTEYEIKINNISVTRKSDNKGIMFMFKNAPFPLKSHSELTMHIKGNTTQKHHLKNGFLSSNPDSAVSVNGPWISPENYIRKLVDSDDNPSEVMCAVSGTNVQKHVIYEDDQHFVI